MSLNKVVSKKRSPSVFGLVALATAALLFQGNSARADSEERDWAVSGAGQSMASIGVLGGLNFSRVSISMGSSSGYSGAGTGFDLGLTSDIRVLNSLFFTPELIYSNKNTVGTTIDLNMKTLSIPLLLKYKVDQANEVFVTSIFIGPTLDFLVASNIEESLAGLKGQGIQIGMDIGVGLDFMMAANFSLGFDVRYHLQFGNVFSYESDGEDQLDSLGISSRVPSVKLLLSGKYYF